MPSCEQVSRTSAWMKVLSVADRAGIAGAVGAEQYCWHWIMLWWLADIGSVVVAARRFEGRRKTRRTARL